MSDVFQFIDKNDLTFPHVKTAGEARAIASEYKTLAEQGEMIFLVFSPEEIIKHLRYTSECWEDIATEMERQGK